MPHSVSGLSGSFTTEKARWSKCQAAHQVYVNKVTTAVVVLLHLRASSVA